MQRCIPHDFFFIYEIKILIIELHKHAMF